MNINFDFRTVWCFLLVVTITGGQFMKGSSPASPSNVLDTCQQQAVATQYNVNRQGQHADVVNLWCSTYQSVVPCIERTLPVTNNVNDWFLSLVFNQSTAMELSMGMCRRFPTISNLSCADEHLRKVASCMKWTTTSAIRHFNELYNPNDTPTPEIRLKAFIYACVISDTTAKCFHSKLTSCSPAQRDLLYDYYIMLSGHCQQIMTRPKTPTLSDTHDGAKVAERKTSPNRDTRPSPLETSTQTEDQSHTSSAGSQPGKKTKEPGGSNTAQENSLDPSMTRKTFRNWNNRQTPVRTGYNRNAANQISRFNNLSILVGILAVLILKILIN